MSQPLPDNDPRRFWNERTKVSEDARFAGLAERPRLRLVASQPVPSRAEQQAQAALELKGRVISDAEHVRLMLATCRVSKGWR